MKKDHVCVTELCVKDGVCASDVCVCHERKIMCATSATQSATKTDPSAPPSAISATPATQNEGRCRQVPRLPRETKVDVAKCHACHAKCRGVTGVTRDQNRANPKTTRPFPNTLVFNFLVLHGFRNLSRWERVGFVEREVSTSNSFHLALPMAMVTF